VTRRQGDKETKHCLGLIVNPVAGLGGRVGLKGSDGLEIQERARALGAQPAALERATEALRALAALPDLELLTYPGEMGAAAARMSGLAATVIGTIQAGRTTAADTRRAAQEMHDLPVELLLFAGGDGTARDIYNAVGLDLPVLGIPAGVKIHSAVYATSPRSAGELATLYLQGRVPRLREAEVVDIDEEAFRQGVVAARLYGYLRVPYRRQLVQGVKTASPAAEQETVRAIARAVVERMEAGCLYIVGPGTTTRAVAAALGLEKTLLGVDVIANGKVLAADAGEAQLLELVRGRRARIIVTPIGGQGYLFGRGNQPISPQVIQAVGPANVVVVSTPQKLQALRGRPLLVDSGDEAIDRLLSGYVRVVTGYNEETMYRVSC
jgi:predicted polyphosphate/ATP-dependent NAD kinase